MYAWYRKLGGDRKSWSRLSGRMLQLWWPAPARRPPPTSLFQLLAPTPHAQPALLKVSCLCCSLSTSFPFNSAHSLCHDLGACRLPRRVLHQLWDQVTYNISFAGQTDQMSDCHSDCRCRSCKWSVRGSLEPCTEAAVAPHQPPGYSDGWGGWRPEQCPHRAP